MFFYSAFLLIEEPDYYSHSFFSLRQTRSDEIFVQFVQILRNLEVDFQEAQRVPLFTIFGIVKFFRNKYFLS